MPDDSRIEWTDATWNPVTGCDKVSPGCDHCYAETIAHRFAGTKAYPDGFAVTLRPERLDQPQRWTRPRRIFVNSMSDLFHSDVPDEFIAKVFAVAALAPQHTYQILTKRPGRMRSLLSSLAFERQVRSEYYLHAGSPASPLTWPLPNVWLGVSVEDQRWADVRIPVLIDTPAAVRFLSMEPLLDFVNLRTWTTDPQEREGRIDWVIVGGESGPHARPLNPLWVQIARDQCKLAAVPFFFKQWGGRTPKANGRELDGRTWDEYPEAAPDNRRTATTAALHRITPAARAHIEQVIRASVSDAGYVSANDFRDRIDARGVLVPTGEWVPSTDSAGGNAGKGCPLYRWAGAPC